MILKDKLKKFVFAFVMAFVVPLCLLQLFPDNPTLDTEKDSQALPQQIPVLLDTGMVQLMDLETYVGHVLAAEMPLSFSPEALKAQAVLARTYACKRVKLSDKHDRGSICTDPTCCQGYDESEPAEIVINAVAQTKGQVLTYNGELIDATYFSCSGGMTEDACEVWGTDIPYLKSVESKGEEKTKHYVTTVHMSKGEFAQALGISGELSGNMFIQNISYTNGGGIKTAEIGGITFTGVELRSMLGLKSTAITVSVADENISITTRGYGHRVGMSQYGANAMAIEGSDYIEILQYYFCDVLLEEY